jgi:hypothetical protein
MKTMQQEKLIRDQFIKTLRDRMNGLHTTIGRLIILNQSKDRYTELQLFRAVAAIQHMGLTDQLADQHTNQFFRAATKSQLMILNKQAISLNQTIQLATVYGLTLP